MRNNFVWLLFTLVSISVFSQRGKDGNYTVTAANTLVNTYTYLTANAVSGATSITVNSNVMSGGAFATNLAQGDLIMLIQMQGASLDVDVTPTASWGGNYTVPSSWTSGGTWGAAPWQWGQVTNYNNCGKFEQVEVLSVSGSNTITLNCALQNSYSQTGRVQVIRIPRFENLTLNSNTSIIPAIWDGNSGGVIALEINGDLNLNSNSAVDASAKGFRGGVSDNDGITLSGGSTCGNGPGIGCTYLGTNDLQEGARKGEGIGGYTTEYNSLFSNYGTGAPANGGGGGGYTNSGGGGGSNVGAGIYTGKGVPNPTYNTAWNLELSGFGGSQSPGGGRGGYSVSSSNQNALVLGPNQTAWAGALRQVNGGFGGHALTLDASRIFMGGGGGAGDQDDIQGGSGGRGGGIVVLTIYGQVTGSGSIKADGEVGIKSNPNNETPSFTSTRKGNDGAGGGGGGGAVYIRNANPISNSIQLSAKGGNGGNQVLSSLTQGASYEAGGPGGGGSGGQVSITSGTPLIDISGGISGVTNSTQVNEFPPNGATDGASGLNGNATTTFNLTAVNTQICIGQTASFSVTASGVLPGTVNWYTSQFGGSSIGTGLTYAPVISPSVTTTYYAGVCPGTFRVPVTVTVNPIPVISGSAVLTNPSCSAPGSITGLTVASGTAPYQYFWNGNLNPTLDYTNLSAGTFNLSVSDANGCSVSSGPYSLTGTSGPIINATGISIQNVSCSGVLGSISGITASGNGLTYSWNNGAGNSPNASNLSAGNYTLTVTDNNGCIAVSGPYTVGTVSGPTIDQSAVAVTVASCGQSNGAVTGITVTGGTPTYSYSWSGTSQTTVNITALSAGSYSLTVTDANGCTVTGTPVIVGSSLGPTLNQSGVIVNNVQCNGTLGSISGITASGSGLTYSWSNGGGNSLNASGLMANTYVLTVTDASGCSVSSAPYTISSSTPLLINSSGMTVAPSSCIANTGSISGISVSGGVNPTYSWSSGQNTLDINGLAAATYILTATDNQGCSATQTVVVGTAVGPTASLISSANVTCNGLSDGEATVAGSGGTGSLAYLWQPGNLTGSSQTTLAAGNYSVLVTDDLGCVSSVSVNIAEPAPLLISALVTPTQCESSSGSISLNVSGGTAPYTYAWSSLGTTTSSISGLSSGSYTSTITDALGCTATSVNTVTTTGSLTLVASPEISTILVGESATLSVSGAASFSWSPGVGLSCSDCSSPIASPTETTTYIVTGTNSDGCTGTVSVQVVVDQNCGDVFVPTIFAPNSTSGKVENQRFGVFGKCISSIVLEVYDRWGNKVYQYSPENTTWDGTYQGRELNAGVFVYRLFVTTTDHRTVEMSGNVTLMR